MTGPEQTRSVIFEHVVIGRRDRVVAAGIVLVILFGKRSGPGH